MQRSPGASPDFFGALAAKRRRGLVTLGGVEHDVPRARLRLHYELQHILESGAADLLAAARAYIQAATGTDPTTYQPEELPPALGALTALNAPLQMAAILRSAQSERLGRQTRPSLALDYPGRWLAGIVSTLAIAYGWTAEYILEELGPEEAWLYVQEALHEEHRRREFEYSLSEVGRDAKGHQKPLLPPDWLGIGYFELEEEKARAMPAVPRSMIPTGTILDFAPRPKTEETA